MVDGITFARCIAPEKEPQAGPVHMNSTVQPDVSSVGYPGAGRSAKSHTVTKAVSVVETPQFNTLRRASTADYDHGHWLMVWRTHILKLGPMVS